MKTHRCNLRPFDCVFYKPIESFTDNYYPDNLCSIEDNINKCQHAIRKTAAELIGEDEIRALSWKQPYAELMLHGKIETRTWPTKYRGWVLICASKQPYFTDQLRRISGIDQIFHMNDFLALTNPHFEGKAIAIGRLVDCRPMLPTDEDKCFVKYWDGLFCHIYEDVIPIEPFPWKGSQGWSKLTDEQKSLIKLK